VTRRGRRFLRGIYREFGVAAQHCGNRRSLTRYSVDIVLSRVLRYVTVPRAGSLRTIRTKSGATITYRLSRADIQTVREVWFDQVYRLPFEWPAGGVLLDLGGNIGCASVYLARRYGFDQVIMVEPVPDNVALARRNLTQNGVDAEIIQGAVAPTGGTVAFTVTADRNLGRIDRGGDTLVELVTPSELLKRAGGRISLVKMDIEGAEEPLLVEDDSWLVQVDAVIAEFHPEIVDYPRLVSIVKERGFMFYPPRSVYERTTDAFRRVL
jgi:FkbM family methyltransferase